MSDNSHRVMALVVRLHALHSEMPDQPDSARAARLGAMIEHEVAETPPEQRGPFLRAMGQLLGDLRGALAVVAGTSASEDSAAESDPIALADRLARLSPTLTAEQRKQVTARLSNAGLGSGGSHGSGTGAVDRGSASLAGRLQLKPGDEVDPDRLENLTGMLVEFISSLDQLVWTTWRAISPDSTFKRTEALKSGMARFAAGDPQPTQEKLRSDMERLRQLTAALTAAVGQAGRQYAQKHLQRFAPVEIERAARDEGGFNVEARCWKKYQTLSASHDVEGIQAELTAAVAAYAETLVRSSAGAGR